MALLRAAEGPQERALIFLALTTGLRIGELLALKWDDVDCGRRELSVNATLDKRRRTRREPKTAHSKRTVPIGPIILEMLEGVRQAQEAQKAYLASYDALELWYDTGHVFVTEEGRPLLYANWRSRAWKRLLLRAGIVYAPPHTLRHTAATLLLAERRTVPNVVAERLGHKDVRTLLMFYSHVLPGQGREAAEEMEALLSTPNVAPDEISPQL
jgi:integrase